MNLIRWEPFREFDHLFSRYAPVLGRTARGEDKEWTPTANISETNSEYLIKAELPEVKKEDVKITLENGVITISGERRHEQEDKSENVLRVESFYGSFTRSFSLPDNIDTQAIRAESKDGVLKIHIPKTSVPQQTITIDVK